MIFEIMKIKITSAREVHSTPKSACDKVLGVSGKDLLCYGLLSAEAHLSVSSPSKWFIMNKKPKC